jgi:hypothetical protein
MFLETNDFAVLFNLDPNLLDLNLVEFRIICVISDNSTGEAFPNLSNTSFGLTSSIFACRKIM